MLVFRPGRGFLPFDSATNMHEQILQLVSQAHALTEQGAVAEPDHWQRKRLVLADLSLHLVQTALRSGPLNVQDLQRQLFSVLTLADGFLDEVDLKPTAEALFTASQSAHPAAQK
ncbi:hypothetical protein [Hymenobacter cellulosilyticus]|uniref:Uncharacterized protein n=1 Tax=Hymenobacter cellulosilyticus TaxID=2932248 RepID=A0A8T9QBK9_9BACT|nr:hypothetical protein [Hymenobacter cellulosilyticus]UOQ73210.1 hypothetical protein MUN79_04360 [Hymenobacter cellulosilyticus]